jgi:hypothetical protein
MIMYSLAEKLRVAGILIVIAGLLCFPFPGENPKRSLSMFTTLADLGVLVRFGIVTTIVGIVVFLVSFLFQKKL